ncbi:hypothetical protein OQA88_11915 [Cercophora sp. LCS_1]
MEIYDVQSSSEQSSPHRQISPAQDERIAEIPILLKGDGIGDDADDEEESHLDEPPPKRRHSISSVESDYEPGSEDEGDEEEVEVTIKKEERDSGSEDDWGHFSNPRQSPLKRSFPSPSHEEDEEGRPDRPFKRFRGEFNPEYLMLLNADIEDAAEQILEEDEDNSHDLPPSQIGFTQWSPWEKVVFFEALARLGPDRALEIAARVQTKSELEVLQYMQSLRDASEARKHRKELDLVQPIDLPAAVELSEACCRALEEVADDISIRQDAHEELVEEEKWGSDHWLITQANHKGIRKDAAELEIKSVELFRSKKWLKLSERIFMNASLDEYNWSGVSDKKPAIRTTAFEDLYALTVSVTRRLVAATLYAAESRIRSKQDTFFPDTGDWVIPRDVETAVLDLKMPENSHKFWAGCARRLRLAVYDDEGPDYKSDSEDEPEIIMSYKDVEAALAEEGEDQRVDSESESELESLSDTTAANNAEKEGDETPAEEDDDTKVPTYPGVQEEEVKRDLKELLAYSALGLSETTRSKHALKSRIRLAHSAEAYADAVDNEASQQAEDEMWRIMEIEPPPVGVKASVPEPPVVGIRAPLDDLLYGSRDWRDTLGHVKRWWEIDTTVEEAETPAAPGTPVTPR